MIAEKYDLFMDDAPHALAGEQHAWWWERMEFRFAMRLWLGDACHARVARL